MDGWWGAVLGLTLRSILAAAAAAAAALTKVPLKVLRGKFGRGLEELFSRWRKGKCLDKVCEDARHRPPPSPLSSSSSFLTPSSTCHCVRLIFGTMKDIG